MNKNPISTSRFSFTSLNRCKHRFIQGLIIGAVSLAAGVTANQFMSNGIPWRVLLLSVSFEKGQPGWQYISVDSVFMELSVNEPFILDLRPFEKYGIDHLPGALPLPFLEFFRDLSTCVPLDSQTPVILYDAQRNSRNTRLTARQLRKMGFNQVTVMRGGFDEWLDKGYPLEPGEDR